MVYQEYEIIIGKKHYRKNYTDMCGVFLCDVSVMLSGLCDEQLKGLPVNRYGYPPPIGTRFPDNSDTKEYTWIPFPYLLGDLRKVDSYDRPCSRRYVPFDIFCGILTKDNIDSFDDITKPAKDYIMANFDWYADDLFRNSANIVYESLNITSNAEKDIILKWYKSQGDSFFQTPRSQDELEREIKEFLESQKTQGQKSYRL